MNPDYELKALIAKQPFRIGDIVKHEGPGELEITAIRWYNRVRGNTETWNDSGRDVDRLTIELDGGGQYVESPTMLMAANPELAELRMRRAGLAALVQRYKEEEYT